MPRKPTQVKKTITVIVKGDPVAVVLHPPSGTRKSWYAFWNGLETSKSTGQRNLQDAIIAAENMVRNGGKRSDLIDAVLSDEEFEEIQRVHYSKRTDPTELARSQKSLMVFLNAIQAFRKISGLDRVVFATADDCSRFQRTALTMPKNWMLQYPKSKKPEDVERISPNTVLKWSRSLQAAFERANRNAGKKCVRGVVDEKRLLTTNPWNQFDWIEERKRPLRQFDAEEIVSVLDYFEARWQGVLVAPILVKIFLWSCCRQQEIAGLKWSSLRKNGEEVHFEIIGKSGVERWFRIPVALYSELENIRNGSPYVFASYNQQLRAFHVRNGRPDNANRVNEEFSPRCLGDWFADRMDDWSATLEKGHAHIHVFRKTGLQYVRNGEDINRQVAKDAKVSESVLMTNYVKETDEQLRQASNRTFARILASLPPHLAQRCGHAEPPIEDLEGELKKAVEGENWLRAADLANRLARREPTER